MKRIMFLFLMLFGLMGSLYAIDTLPSGCDIQKSQTLSEIDGIVDIPQDVAFVKVNILHRDTLMYSVIPETSLIIRRSGVVCNTKTYDILGISGGYRTDTGDSIKI